MWAAAVVKAEIVTDPGAGFRNAGIGVQVDLFVFDGSPEALYEDVVAPSSLAICYRQVFASKHREAC